jgi:hypothetical protein
LLSPFLNEEIGVYLGKAMEHFLEHISEYHQVCRIQSRAHYLAADHYDKLAQFVGVPVIILTAVVGTAIFATLESNPDLGWKIATGCVSVFAAVLSALQTYFNFAGRAEKHRAAGPRYSALRRELAVSALEIRNATSPNVNEVSAKVRALIRTLDDAASMSPTIPDRCWDRASAERQDGTPTVALIHGNKVGVT